MNLPENQLDCRNDIEWDLDSSLTEKSPLNSVENFTSGINWKEIQPSGENLENQISDLREAVNWNRIYINELTKKVNEISISLEIINSSLARSQLSQLAATQGDSFLLRGKIFDYSDMKLSGCAGYAHNMEPLSYEIELHYKKLSQISCDLSAMINNFCSLDFQSGDSIEQIEEIKIDFAAIQSRYADIESSDIDIERELYAELEKLAPRKLHNDLRLREKRREFLSLWCRESIFSVQIQWALNSFRLIADFLPEIWRLSLSCSDQSRSVNALKKNPELVDTRITGFYLKPEKKEFFESELCKANKQFNELKKMAFNLQEKWGPVLKELPLVDTSFPEELAPGEMDREQRLENRREYNAKFEAATKQRERLYKLLLRSWSALKEEFNGYCINIIQTRHLAAGSLPVKMFMHNQDQNSLSYEPPLNFM